MVDFGFLETQITTKGTDRLMSTREKLIKARLGLLALAQELDNVRLACKRAGISRSPAPRSSWTLICSSRNVGGVV